MLLCSALKDVGSQSQIREIQIWNLNVLNHICSLIIHCKKINKYRSRSFGIFCFCSQQSEILCHLSFYWNSQCDPYKVTFTWWTVKRPDLIPTALSRCRWDTVSAVHFDLKRKTNHFYAWKTVRGICRSRSIPDTTLAARVPLPPNTPLGCILQVQPEL